MYTIFPTFLIVKYYSMAGTRARETQAAGARAALALFPCASARALVGGPTPFAAWPLNYLCCFSSAR